MTNIMVMTAKTDGLHKEPTKQDSCRRLAECSARRFHSCVLSVESGAIMTQAESVALSAPRGKSRIGKQRSGIAKIVPIIV